VQRNKKLYNLWVVVKVESGIPASIQAFRSIKSAERCERRLNMDLRADYDATGVFEVQIPGIVSQACAPR
jgi:hypothetical protein